MEHVRRRSFLRSPLTLALALCLLVPASFVSAQVSAACPRDADFWSLQCDGSDTCPATVCPAGLENLWRCVITETDVIQWRKTDGSFETTASLAALSNANLAAALCSHLNDRSRDSMTQLEIQYLTLMLNVCVGALPLDVQFTTRGFTGTIGSAIDDIEQALNTNLNLDFWKKAAQKINRGNGLNAADCADPDGLFANVPPCNQ